MRLLTICSMFAGTLLGTAISAAVTYTSPTANQPMVVVAPAPPTSFSPAVLAQIRLTHAQRAEANRIVRQTNNALYVTVSQAYASRIEDISTSYEPIDQAMAEESAALQQEMARRHPDPVAVAAYSDSLAQLAAERQVIIATGNAELLAILTPSQQRQYMELASARIGTGD